MTKLDAALGRLKNKGYRFSAVRNFLLKSLAQSRRPLSVLDFQKLLKPSRLSVNRTTLYRELNLLKREGIILEIQLKDSKRWYELALKDHRHHLVCVKCDKINDLRGCDSKLMAKILKQSPDFAEIQSHTLVFFGLCKLCAKIKK